MLFVQRDLFEWITVDPSERLYEPLQTYLVALGSIFSAAATIRKWSAPDPDSGILLHSRRLELCLLVPALLPLKAAIEDQPLDGISVGIAREIEADVTGESTLGFASFLRAIRMALLVAFIDRNLEWVDETYGKDVNKHPDILRFCRTVRNAAAHQGIVTIRNERSQPASWRGLEIGPGDNGRHIFQSDLGDADAVLLLMDLSRHLDAFGAPR